MSLIYGKCFAPVRIPPFSCLFIKCNDFVCTYSKLIILFLFLSLLACCLYDEISVSYVNVEQNKQSRKWGHTSSPRKSIKCRQTFSNKKVMATFGTERGFFWWSSWKGVLRLIRQCEILKKLRRVIQIRRRGLWQMAFLPDQCLTI